MNPHPIAHSIFAMGQCAVSYSYTHGAVNVLAEVSTGRSEHSNKLFQPCHIALNAKA